MLDAAHLMPYAAALLMFIDDTMLHLPALMAPLCCHHYIFADAAVLITRYALRRCYVAAAERVIWLLLFDMFSPCFCCAALPCCRCAYNAPFDAAISFFVTHDDSPLLRRAAITIISRCRAMMPRRSLCLAAAAHFTFDITPYAAAHDAAAIRYMLMRAPRARY